MSANPSRNSTNKSVPLGLYHLLDPEVLANPYPLYERLRTEAPVHWDPYLHAWIVTRYADVVTVLHHFSANRTPTPEHFAAMGLAELGPIAQLMTRQMLFMEGAAHARLRGLASMAFTPARVEVLRAHIREIVDQLMEPLLRAGRMDVINDLAAPLPAIVTAEMLGVPTSDCDQLKAWSADFAEVLGNFQHNPDRASRTLKCVEEMSAYFRNAIRRMKTEPREGLINSFMTAEIEGDRLSEDEIVANCIVTMVGGQETTTNLIGNGILSLLRNPDQLQRLREELTLIPSAVEELLRYESPSQHTARICPEDTELGGKQIRKGQAVIAVMGAGNRDPERFPEPDRLDLGRADNRHLAFGWASHFCFGAALARIEGQLVFEAVAGRMFDLKLDAGPLIWRDNLGLRGLESLSVTFTQAPAPRSVAPVLTIPNGCPFHTAV
jgi:pimeloyl-[acyl-carrier protein] synthase